MLTRQTNVSPNQEYYSDSMLTLPTTAHSAFENLAAGIATPFIMANDIGNTLSQHPTGQALNDTLAGIELENQTPGMGFTQRSANFIANMIGYGINPISWGFGEIGGLAARGIGAGAEAIAPDAVSAFMRKPLSDVLAQPLSKWVPQTIGEGAEQKTLSAGLLSQSTIDNFGKFAGATVPMGVVDNYNNDTNNISWGGIARESGTMGALGIAIGAIPFTFGLLRGKINRGLGEDPSTPINTQTLSKALDGGVITPEEHAWYTDYLAVQANPKDVQAVQGLKDRASQIVNRNGQSANVATNEVPFDILDADTIKNVNNVTADQLIADVPENAKTALSDYLIHNRLDNLRENPQQLDGVRGYVDTVNEKLAAKPEQLAKADKILDEYMLKGMKKNMPFSQKELFNKLKETDTSNTIYSLEDAAKHLPVVVPEDVLSEIRRLKYIDHLEKQNEKLFIKFKKTGNQDFVEDMKRNNEIIEDRKARPSKLLTPKEELMQIKEDLFKTKLSVSEPDYYHIAPETYEEGQALKSLFSKKGIGSLSDFLKKWRDDLFEGDFSLMKDQIKVLKEHPKLVFLFKKDELDRAIEWLKSNKGKVKTNIKKNKLLGIYDAANELKTYKKLDYMAVPHEIPARFIKDITHDLYHSGLVDNWERSDAYHRLVDLANVWHNANTLLDRVHLEGEYNKQEAFRDLAKQVLDVADSDQPRLAQPDNVINYLKSRIEGTVFKREPIEFAEAKARAETHIPSDVDTVLGDQEAQVRDSGAQDLAKEFSMASDKFKEFKSSESVFKNLISCVLGSLNG